LRFGSGAPATRASPCMNKTNSASSLPAMRDSFSPVGFLPVRLVQIDPHRRTKCSRAGFDGPRSRSSNFLSVRSIARVAVPSISASLLRNAIFAWSTRCRYSGLSFTSFEKTPAAARETKASSHPRCPRREGAVGSFTPAEAGDNIVRTIFASRFAQHCRRRSQRQLVTLEDAGKTYITKLSRVEHKARAGMARSRSIRVGDALRAISIELPSAAAF
jgi:hypothetical protein